MASDSALLDPIQLEKYPLSPISSLVGQQDYPISENFSLVQSFYLVYKNYSGPGSFIAKLHERKLCKMHEPRITLRWWGNWDPHIVPSILDICTPRL